MAEWPLRAEEIIDLVRNDIRANLGPMFEPERGFDASIQIEPADVPVDEIPMRNPTSAGVAWRYRGVHVSDFAGVLPTGNPVEIIGYTHIHQDREQNTFIRRYVDWTDVLAQLGSLPGRAVAPTVG